MVRPEERQAAEERRASWGPGVLRTLLGLAADTPVYVYDRDLRAVDFFWEGEEGRWGIDPSALLGRRVSEIVDPEEAEPFERAIREVLETGQPGRFEGAFDLPVGLVRFEVRLAPIRGAGGDVEYVLSVPRDVTEQRRAEQALSNARRRFETLAESLPVGVLIEDAEGRFVYRNRRARELGGLPDAALGGDSWRAYVHPDDLSGLAAARIETYRSPRPLEVEFRVLSDDGSYRWLSSRSVPTRNDEGRFSGFLTILTDVTASKAAEAALRESEHRFRTLAEALPIGVWRTDTELRIVYANRRNWDLLGLDPGDPDNLDLGRLLAGLQAAEQLEAGELERLRQESRQAVRDRRMHPSGFRLRRADGSEWVFHTLALPELDSEGRFIGHVGVTIDMTEIVRAREEVARHRDHLGELVAERTVELERTHEALRRSERLAAVGTFAAGIAHQINNPVGAILLAAQFALDDPGDRRRVEAALRDIVSESRQCGRIVRGVLEFARGPIGDLQPCDLNGIAVACARQLEEEAAPHGAALRLELEAGIPAVYGSEASVEQVVINLVHNSLQAGATEITIATRREEGAVGLVVRDDGVGIPEDDVDRVFDPLFTTRGSRGGAGLGLALARGIVFACGGSIELRSRAGQGTEVTVRLEPAEPISGLSGPGPA